LRRRLSIQDSVQLNNLLIPAPCSFNVGVTDLNIAGHKEFGPASPDLIR
jgi:hypothetical protein